MARCKRPTLAELREVEIAILRERAAAARAKRPSFWLSFEGSVLLHTDEIWPDEDKRPTEPTAEVVEALITKLGRTNVLRAWDLDDAVEIIVSEARGSE